MNDSTKSSPDFIPGSGTQQDIFNNNNSANLNKRVPLGATTNGDPEQRISSGSRKIPPHEIMITSPETGSVPAARFSSDSSDLHLHIDTQSSSQSDSGVSTNKESGKFNGVIDHSTNKEVVATTTTTEVTTISTTATHVVEYNSSSTTRQLVEYDQISDESSTNSRNEDFFKPNSSVEEKPKDEDASNGLSNSSKNSADEASGVDRVVSSGTEESEKESSAAKSKEIIPETTDEDDTNTKSFGSALKRTALRGRRGDAAAAAAAKKKNVTSKIVADDSQAAKKSGGTTSSTTSSTDEDAGLQGEEKGSATTADYSTVENNNNSSKSDKILAAAANNDSAASKANAEDAMASVKEAATSKRKKQTVSTSESTNEDSSDTKRSLRSRDKSPTKVDGAKKADVITAAEESADTSGKPNPESSEQEIQISPAKRKRGRPPASSTPKQGPKQEQEPKHRTRGLNSSESSASEEPRQLRKRAPQDQPAVTPNSTKKKESADTSSTKSTPKAAGGESAKSASKSARVGDQQQQQSATPQHHKPAATTTTPTTTGKKKSSLKTPSKHFRQQQQHQQQQLPRDTYDFEETTPDDPSSMAPLKHVHVARGHFMDIKYTKTNTDDGTTRPKFAALSQSAEKRRQESFKSPESSSPTKLQNSNGGGNPGSGKRDYSGKKDALSSGELADVSSFGSKTTTTSTFTISTTSTGVKSSLESMQSDKSPPKRSKSDEKQQRRSGLPTSKRKQRLSGATSGSATSGDEFFEEADEVLDAARNLKNTATATKKRGRSSTKLNQSASAADSSDLSPVARKRSRAQASSVTKEPRQPKLPEMTPDEQLACDFPVHTDTATQHQLQEGARVFAKWADKCFYPANIVVNLGLGRYKVKFVQDNAYRDLPFPDLVPLASLKPTDKLMFGYATADDDLELQPVEILNTPPATNSQEWFSGLFEVRNSITGNVEKVPWVKFIIDVEQTKAFVSSLINKAAQDIVADNISESRVRRNRGKRAESPDVAAEAQGAASATESGAEQQENAAAAPKKRPSSATAKRRHQQTASGSNSSATGTPKRQKTATTFSPGSGRSSATKSSSTSTKKRRTAAANLEDGNRSSASPRGRPSKAELKAAMEYAAAGHAINEDVAENRMFDGMKFVLTSANRVKTSAESLSEEERPSVPFNKKQMRQMIDHYGGSVVDDFAILADTKDCFLIADQYYRTHKYLSALARAVPCVSHMWIHDCCNKDAMLPHENYMLPAGQSLETNAIIEWHEQCPRLLKDTRVFVYTENRPTNPGALDFVQIWAPLVKCMGAKLLEKLPEGEGAEAHVDILLTDISCPNHVLTKAAKLGASAVSSEWLIQAIITGSKPRPDGHPKYRYDYIEPQQQQQQLLQQQPQQQQQPQPQQQQQQLELSSMTAAAVE